MKKLIALAIISSISIAAAPAFAQNANDSLCGPDGPEAYKRPGGYCEQIAAPSLVKSEQEERIYNIVD